MPVCRPASLIASILMLLSGWLSTAAAAPALPIERELVQPDGSRFLGRLVGDEWNHQVEIGKGYTVARDAGGWWRYVSGYRGAEPLLDATPAHRSPPAAIAPHAQADAASLFSPPRPALLTRTAKAAPHGAFQGHVLYLLVDFTDVAGSTTEADWESFVSDQLIDYFDVNSHGLAQLQPARESYGGFDNGVVGWLRMPYPHPQANDYSNLIDSVAMHVLVRDAVIASDPYVDYAQYDSNGDGMIGSSELAVVVVAAGGEAAAFDVVSIWGHAWSVFYAPVPVADGVSVASGGDGQHGYAAFGEMHGQHQATLGIMAHELGHLIFDLPDLYDTNPVPEQSSGIGAFGLMGSGSWGYSFDDLLPGQTPVMLSAWSRYTLGWTRPKTPLGRMAVTAASAATATADNSVLLAETGRAGEYFLIENRQPQGYDRGLERWLAHSFGGFAIWHVDEGQPDNSDESHRLVDLEEADSSPMGTSKGSYTDLWFGGNTVSPGAFGPTTSPGSRRYDGVDSEVALRDFSVSGEVMTLEAAGFNQAPTAVDDSERTDEDVALITADVTANDLDREGNLLEVVATPGEVFPSTEGGEVSYLGNGSFRYLPPPHFNGVDDFGYAVSDGAGSASARVVIAVDAINDAPLTPVRAFEISEDTALADLWLLAGVIDIEGDPVRLLGVDALSAQGGSISQLADGSYQYQPAANFHGSDSFGYRVDDGRDERVGLVSIQVLPVNDPPTASDDLLATTEDTELQVTPLGNDFDIDGDPLQLVSFDSLTGAGGSVVQRSPGTLRYSPPADFHGEDSFAYGVSDGQGGFASARVTISVTPLNDPPSAGIDRFATDEDRPLAIAGLLDNDSDADGDPLSLLNIDSESAAGGVLSALGDGQYLYAPAADFHGEDRFSYRVGDGRGGATVGAIIISVAPVNDLPQALDDQRATDEDQPLELADLLANDSDVDGDPLSLLSLDGASVAGGVIVALGEDRYRYTPPANFHGEDSFGYRLGDGAGGEAAARVTVAVRSLNDAPQAGADVATTTVAQAVDIAVLDNDVDVDGDEFGLIAFDPRSAAGGSVSDLGDGRLRYRPADDFVGEDRFGYTLRDAAGAESRGLVSVQVLPGRQLAQPSLQPPGGSSHEPISVRVSCEAVLVEAGAALRYTTDGSQPGADHGTPLACGDSLRLEQSAQLHVVAMLAGWRDSPAASASYEIDPLLDSDGDGLPDAWELAHGLDPANPADATADSDGDGLSNLEEYEAQLDPHLDDVPPALLPPADIAVDASGWYTAVALGEALASDAVDGVLIATPDRLGPFTPGRHEVRWRASDAAGNLAEAVQRVDVRPQVLFGGDRQASEGSVVRLPIELSGDAPAYPVTLHYRVSGSADSEDHDAVDGQLLIDSGHSAELAFRVHRNDPVGEPDEVLRLTFHAAEGAVLGDHREVAVTLVERNLAPRAQLSLWQDGVPVASPSLAGGAVELRTDASDSEGGELSLDWSGSSLSLAQHGRADGATLVVDDAGLLSPSEAGHDHEALVLISDSAAPPASLHPSLFFRMTEGPATLDLDGDGVGDAGDALIQPHSLQLEASGEAPLPRIATLPGLQLRIGRVARLSDRLGARISLDDIQDVSRVAARGADYVHSSDIFDLQISGLDQPGDSVPLVLPLSQAMGSASEVRFLAGDWRGFSAGSGEALKGALADGGCPMLRSNSYREALSGADCLQLIVRDGGENDADSAANGQISLLLSVATRREESSDDAPNASGGGGSAAWWWLLALLWMGRVAGFSRARSRSA